MNRLQRAVSGGLTRFRGAVSRTVQLAIRWVGDNPRSLHVYPGTVLIGWALWRWWSVEAAAVVVGAIMVYFGAFWRPPGARGMTRGE